MTSTEKRFYAAFGRRVQKARNLISMTQTELAAQAGTTRAAIGNIECGRQRVLGHTAFALSQALCVPLIELMVKP